MFKEDKFVVGEQRVGEKPPRRRWTCGAKQCGRLELIREMGRQEWSYDSNDWCEPVEVK